MPQHFPLPRNTGMAVTMSITRKSDGSAIDCTGCSAYFQIREVPGAVGNALVDLSTDVAPTPTNSGMEWVDASLGQLFIRVIAADTQNIDLFPRAKQSPNWNKTYYSDVVVLDSDGLPKVPTIPFPLDFEETVSVLP